MHCNLRSSDVRPGVLGCFWPNMYCACTETATSSHNSDITIRLSDLDFLKRAIIWRSDDIFRRFFFTVQMVKLMNCHVWYEVNVKETVSGRAHEVRWELIAEVRCSVLKRAISDFERWPGWWTSKSDHRRRTCVVTGLNRDQVVEILRLVRCKDFIC